MLLKEVQLIMELDDNIKPELHLEKTLKALKDANNEKYSEMISKIEKFMEDNPLQAG